MVSSAECSDSPRASRFHRKLKFLVFDQNHKETSGTEI
jgi:hypothetical protein